MMQGFLKLTEASGAQLWVLLVAIFFRQVSVTLLDPQWASHQKNIHLIVNCSLMTLTDYLQVGRLKWKVGIFVIQSLAIVPARICNFIGINFSSLLFLEKISFFFWLQVNYQVLMRGLASWVDCGHYWDKKSNASILDIPSYPRLEQMLWFNSRRSHAVGQSLHLMGWGRGLEGGQWENSWIVSKSV